MSHYPVMLAEVLDAISPVDGGVYVDGTFGAGGYTKAILDAANCTVVAIDRDPDAQKRAAEIDSDRLIFLRGLSRRWLQAPGNFFDFLHDA